MKGNEMKGNEFKQERTETRERRAGNEREMFHYKAMTKRTHKQLQVELV